MKKRKVLSLTLAAAVAACPLALTGCSGDHYSAVSFKAQDTAYAVTSQGGSAVGYGNYVYFINGTRGYDDTDAKANVWNEVVKGGLYRAEFNGDKYVDDDEVTRFQIKSDDKGVEFVYTPDTDYFGESINNVTVEAIARKTIGTSGYGAGGIFIYDNFVFFASPNNEKNATGTVQTTRTDFFMLPLSGGKPVKVYTTSSGVDTTSSAYAFYKRNNAVYLVVNESGTIVSVRIDLGKKKADDPKAYAVNATGVFFPVRDTYYKGIDNNTTEDFIYYVRATTDEDSQRSGTVICAMRPDGTEQMIIRMANTSDTIEAVRDGVLFYRTTNAVNESVIAYDSLHNAFMEHSPTYKAAQDKLPESERNSQISGRFSKAVGDFTSVYPFRLDRKSNIVNFVGVTNSATELYQSSESDQFVGTLCTTTGTPLFIQENYLYTAGSSSGYYKVPLTPNLPDYGASTAFAENSTNGGLAGDYVGGYFTYNSQVDQWASNYTFFYKVYGKEGMEPQFVGARSKADTPTEEQIKEANGETDSND